MSTYHLAKPYYRKTLAHDLSVAPYTHEDVCIRARVYAELLTDTWTGDTRYELFDDIRQAADDDMFVAPRAMTIARINHACKVFGSKDYDLKTYSVY